jgi:undecaprenyl-phosphate 4-deoxy-4-formamido-L-arabinose transferase
MCGFRHSRGALVVTMDDDLQNPPEDVPKLVAAMAAGRHDVVYGAYGRKQHPAFRNLGSWLVNAFYRRVFRTGVTVTAFRIIRRPVLDATLSYDLNFTFLDGLLAWHTDRFGEAAVEHHPRRQGRSGYTLRRLVLLALNLYTNFSLAPLQVTSALGVLAAAGGVTTGLVYLVRALLRDIAVPGYASTIVAVLILGGLQLLALGMLGEYLGRLHLNVNRKPQYAEREVLEGRPRPPT